MRSPTQSNLALDCENGSISREYRFEPCLYNQTCHSEDLLILKDLIQHGYALDIFYITHGDPGKYSMDINNNIYRIQCTEVEVTYIKNKKCYAENLIPILIKGKQRFLGRGRFVVDFAIEVPCEKTTVETQVRQEVSNNLASAYCLEAIVLGLIRQINTQIDFSTLFNDKSMESLIMIKEAFTYGCPKGHLIIRFVLLFKKYSPFIFLGYSILNYSHAVLMFFIAFCKRLPIKIALSFIFRCLKHQKDLKKYLDSQKDLEDKKQRLSLRKSVLENDMTDEDVQADHIEELYETIIQLNKRLKFIEAFPKRFQKNRLRKMTRKRETAV